MIKILPSYLILIFGSIALSFHFYFSSAQSAAWTFRQVVLHLLFIHNWFEDGYGSIGLVLWSLGVEVQFYLIFPLIAWCMLRQLLLTMLYALSWGMLDRRLELTRQWVIVGNPAHQLPGEIDLFVTGMYAAYLFRALATRHQAFVHPSRAWAWTLLGVTGLFLYAATSHVAYTAYERPYDRFLVPLLDIAFFSTTLGFLFGVPTWRIILGNPLLTFYAGISYNFYLWHLVVQDQMLKHDFPHIDPSDPHWLLFFTLFNCLCSSLLAALLTYGIERPLMRLTPFVKPAHAPTS
jgi:peptidoglycan/LPS O-acetylase OafA/YrhL